VRPLQSVHDPFWFTQELPYILPDNIVQLSGGDVAGTASFVVPRVEGLRQAAASIIAPATVGRPRNAGRLASSAADQRPQQILIGFVVTRGLFHIQSEFSLDSIEVLFDTNAGIVPTKVHSWGEVQSAPRAGLPSGWVADRRV